MPNISVPAQWHACSTLGRLLILFADQLKHQNGLPKSLDAALFRPFQPAKARSSCDGHGWQLADAYALHPAATPRTCSLSTARLHSSTSESLLLA